MRLNYSVIANLLVLILMLLVMSVRVQAQTASTKSRSAIITPLMQQHLDEKSQQPASNNNAPVLPSNNGVPEKARQAKQQHSHASQGTASQLPSSSRVDIEKIRKRNSTQRFPQYQK